MDILMTGCGLIGAYAARTLHAQGHRVTLADQDPQSAYVNAVVGASVELVQVDVRDVEGMTRVVLAARPHVLIHTAGALKGQFDDDPFGAYETNVCGTLRVAEAARRAGCERLILCSSLAVYDFAAYADVITEEHPVAPQSLYDHSKLLAERIAEPYCAAHGLPLVILRLAGVYGAGRFRGGAWMGRKLQEAMLLARDGHPIDALCASLGTNEYLYVKDAARAIAAACTAYPVDDQVVNIGPGCLVTPPALAQAIYAAFPIPRSAHALIDQDDLTGQGISEGPHAVKAPPHLRRCAALSLRKARRMLGYVPLYGEIGVGISDYAHELVRLGSVIKAL